MDCSYSKKNNPLLNCSFGTDGCVIREFAQCDTDYVTIPHTLRIGL